MKKKDEHLTLRAQIRKILKEGIDTFLIEDELDEERIANKDAYINIDAKENFVGSHCYGEDLGKQVGNDDELYVVYSYGHPLYMFVMNSKGGQWYENMNEYMVDGRPYTFSEKHRLLLRPRQGPVREKLGGEIVAIIQRYKIKHGIKDTTHTDVPIGEK